MRLKIAERRRQIDANTCKVPTQKGREANYAPLSQVERLKKNLLRQLERFTEGLEDFNFWPGTIHGAILNRFGQSNQARYSRCLARSARILRAVFRHLAERRAPAGSQRDYAGSVRCPSIDGWEAVDRWLLP
jgi:hypothetical protein